jgi:hypothetical protein
LLLKPKKWGFTNGKWRLVNKNIQISPQDGGKMMYYRNNGSIGKLMVMESFNSLIFLEICVYCCLLGIASGSSSLWV